MISEHVLDSDDRLANIFEVCDKHDKSMSSTWHGGVLRMYAYIPYKCDVLIPDPCISTHAWSYVH